MVAAIMNTINRYDITPECTRIALERAGMPMDLFITDNGSSDKRIVEWGQEVAKHHTANETNMGNPYALNRMIQRALEDGYTYIVTLGNDLILPEDWLVRSIEALEKCPQVGVIGYKCDNVPEKHVIKRNGVHFATDKTNVVIGITTIRADVYRKIGYLNEFSNYGHWDATFCRRAQKHYSAFYLHGCKAHHVGTPAGDPDMEYLLMKKAEAEKAWVKAQEWHKQYQNKNVYLDIDQNVHLGRR